MKRILFIIPAFEFGGTNFSTINMISLLDSNIYDINILAMSHQGPLSEKFQKWNILKEDILLSSLVSKWKSDFSFLQKIFFIGTRMARRIFYYLGINSDKFIYESYIKKNKKESYDIVVACQEGAATYLASSFNSINKIAWFRCEYSFYRLPYIIKDESKIYEKFNSIVCVSEHTKRDFCKHLPKVEHKVYAIHNAQNFNNIIADSAYPCDDERYTNDVFTIISVGRFDPVKRFSEIPAIVKELKDSNLKFKWYLIGAGDMFNEKLKIEKVIQDYEVQEELILLGAKINPYPYIKNSSLLVNLSLTEACPRVVNEAKILNTPVICADFGSATEFITNDYNGYVVPLDEITDVIRNMIMNKDKYSKIKKNCLDFVFDNNKILTSLSDIFTNSK